MADTSAIEWTDATWNPVTGCDRVSPGCANCYALDLAARLKRMGQARYQRDGGKASGPGFGVTLHSDKLAEPLRWRKPRMVFVNSMSDLFHEEIPDEFISRVFDVIRQCSYPAYPDHTFQILTKRPERMREFVLAYAARAQEYAAKFDALPPSTDRQGWCGATSDSPAAEDARRRAANPLPNVWLGVSIENRRFVGRADLIRDLPCAVRFISAEPLLGPLLFDAHDGAHGRGRVWSDCSSWPGADDGYDRPELDLTGIDWLIVGGESGPKHRPIREEWVRDLRDACLDQGLGHLRPHPAGRTAFFFKQWGGRTAKSGGRVLDGRTWDEFPAGAGVPA